MTQLSQKTLHSLDARVAVPRYDRQRLTPGIIHFGVGNFHRAHQACYLDSLFNQGLDHDWAILGAGMLPSDEAMRASLAPQDYLSTVVTQEASRSDARVTGAMIDFLPVKDVPAILARLADPQIRLVSLTITEAGYFMDATTGHFDPDHPKIIADSASSHAPQTVFGLLAAGLRQRQRQGIAPYTILSCDNVPHNGSVTRNAVVTLARLSDPALADWIEAHVAFPSSMVDRITPATGERERRLTQELFGITDAWPVFCEDFQQWVIEDHFPQGRPALERVGVQFVGDVNPYETMKIRILNGGHAAIAYLAGLLDIHFVHEAMAHPLVAGFLDKVERAEIIPIVPPVPGVDLVAYFQRVTQRFANPKIGDTVPRLCYDGANRQPKFIIPSIVDRLARQAPVEGLALASALWCRYCAGKPDDSRLHAIAVQARESPAAWLSMSDVYGPVAGGSAPFRQAFSQALRDLWTEGVEETVARYLR